MDESVTDSEIPAELAALDISAVVSQSIMPVIDELLEPEPEPEPEPKLVRDSLPLCPCVSARLSPLCLSAPPRPLAPPPPPPPSLCLSLSLPRSLPPSCSP